MKTWYTLLLKIVVSYYSLQMKKPDIKLRSTSILLTTTILPWNEQNVIQNVLFRGEIQQIIAYPFLLWFSTSAIDFRLIKDQLASNSKINDDSDIS